MTQGTPCPSPIRRTMAPPKAAALPLCVLVALLGAMARPAAAFSVPVGLPRAPPAPWAAAATPLTLRGCSGGRCPLAGARGRAPGAAGARCSLTSDGVGGERMKGVLKVTDAETGAPVYLVGAMHYNPVSIRRTKLTVQNLANAGELAAVVIESCASRWNSTLNQPQWMRKVLSSEMGAAATLAQESGVELVLGDQPIEETSKDMEKTLKATIDDLKSPLTGGWGRLGADVYRAGTAALAPREDGYGLGAQDLLDPALMAATPVTFLRYPLAWLIRAPQTAVSVVLGSVALSLIPDFASALISASVNDSDSNLFLAYLVGLAFSALELVFIVRLFLVALLDTRNEILAQNIRDACSRSAAVAASSGTEPNAVVAVLGMAHVNGVQKMLREKGAPSSTGVKKDTVEAKV